MINKHLRCHIPVSIIIPCFNEEENIQQCLLDLHPLRERGCEVIVVDGGSRDATVQKATPLADYLLQSLPGRAKQMNFGARYASGEWLLFLHSDSKLPDDINAWIDQLNETHLLWGFFPVNLSGQHWLFRCIETAMSWRSRLSAIATGDQCQFVRREMFMGMNGFTEIPLMEDIELSARLRKLSRPLIWSSEVVTSSRRWEQQGIFKTIILMWGVRLGYFFGVKPAALHKVYYGKR